MHQEVATLKHLLFIWRNLPGERVCAASFNLALYEILFDPLFLSDALRIGILSELVILLVLDLLELIFLLHAFHPVQERVVLSPSALVKVGNLNLRFRLFRSCFDWIVRLGMTLKKVPL